MPKVAAKTNAASSPAAPYSHRLHHSTYIREHTAAEQEKWDKQWRKDFSELEVYFAKHKHFRALRRNDPPVFTWLVRQRNDVLHGKMLPGSHRYILLERLGVWEFMLPTTASQAKSLAAAAASERRNDSSKVAHASSTSAMNDAPALSGANLAADDDEDSFPDPMVHSCTIC
ncbi:hypothetical protein MPSEU_000752300 [Mayamaea pseudoterrestris]|nr:hypothetical protein MPSEU_000752300 [Mayamaea pseudoterrestris]